MLEAKNLLSDPFFSLLASTKGTGQLSSLGRIFFMQPVLCTKACPCYYSFQSWYCLILLKCLCLLLTLQLLDNMENLKAVALPQTGLFNPPESHQPEWRTEGKLGFLCSFRHHTWSRETLCRWKRRCSTCWSPGAWKALGEACARLPVLRVQLAASNNYNRTDSSGTQ